MTINPFSSAVALAAGFRRSDLSPVDVAQVYLDRIEELDGEINAIVWLDSEDTLARARASERRYQSGEPLSVLDGVPIPIKSLTPVRGQPFNSASAAVKETIAEESALSVELLESAGLVLMGQTNGPEFGPLGATENQRYGKTRNPWDTEYSPSGSSGGAAAAVCAGLAPVAHGSDGAGSIRVPAATTGLVGLKPSRGRVPSRLHGWEHSTVEGAITRTVADSAAMLDVLGVEDRYGLYTAPRPAGTFLESAGQPLAPLRVGILLTPPVDLPVDPECAAAATGLADVLSLLGHSVMEVSPFLYSEQAVVDYNAFVVSAWISALELDYPDRADAYIRHRFECGQSVTATQYVRLVTQLQTETRRVVQQWGDNFDILLTPTSAVPTVPVGLVYDEANSDPYGPRTTELRQIAFTAFCNMAGLPAISVPVHTGQNGLPIGAQLVAGPYGEATLLQLAASLESVYRWDRIHVGSDTVLSS